MRTVFWDLETTALKASFGQILCGVGGEYNPINPTEPVLTEFRLADFSTPKGRCDDKSLAVEIGRYLEQFDLVVGYYSKRFDEPFLNTRLAKHNLPAVKLQRHKDIYFVMKTHFSLQSNSLENVSIFLFGKTLKTKLSWDLWRLAHAGDAEAYEAVVEHCRYDVKELARVWDRVKSVAGDLKK